MRRTLLVAFAAAMTVALVAGPSGAVIPGVGVISKKNMEWVWNNPQAAGSDLEFYEEKLPDGTLKRYAIAGAIGHGFQIIDITNPAMPTIVSNFVDPGANYQGDIQVNPRRKIVAIGLDGTGATLAHGGGEGVTFVDISDVRNPTLLGVRSDVEGAHTLTMVHDNYIYTSGPTYILDYSDPKNPKNLGKRSQLCSTHDITVDPNDENTIYLACPSRTFQIVDVSDPVNPVVVVTKQEPGVSIAHQLDPAPDGSYIILTDERGGGLTNFNAPGGGLHFYDISGKYTEPNVIGPASRENPIKFGQWYPPFNGVATSETQSGYWGNVTSHVMTFQAERFLLSIGWYTMGTWVADLEHKTNGTGPYREWSGTHSNGGPTTWGNTVGNLLPEGDEVWSSKWTRFDDAKYDRYIFTNGLTRGVDTLLYTGAMPLKIARLNVDDTASGGAVTGKLDRYAVWTYNGWENRPLAGKTLYVSAGGRSVSTTSDADGSFSADLGLGAGDHTVVVTWADPAGVYRTTTAVQTVSG